MLRKGGVGDIDTIVDIWLWASLQSHDFIEAASWWQAQETLRIRYLQYASIWVFEEKGELLGFMGLMDNYLAALFVRPENQQQGVGHALLQQAKRHASTLYTKIFVENRAAVQFYLHHGFVIVAEEMDPLTNHPQYKMCFNVA